MTTCCSAFTDLPIGGTSAKEGVTPLLASILHKNEVVVNFYKNIKYKELDKNENMQFDRALFASFNASQLVPNQTSCPDADGTVGHVKRREVPAAVVEV